MLRYDFSIFIGGMAILLILQMLRFLFLRQKIDAYFSFFLLSIASFGLFRSQIWNHQSLLNLLLNPEFFEDKFLLILQLCVLFGSLWLRQFFDGLMQDPLLRSACRTASLLVVLSMVSNILFQFTIADFLNQILLMSAILLLFAASLRFGFNQKNRYLTLHLGWVAGVIALVFQLITSLELTSPDFVIDWIPWISAVFGSAFFSFAISERSHHIEIHASRERNKYLDRLIVKEKARRHTFQQFGKLLYPHQLDLIERGYELESTMPVGHGQAFIIRFNTIASLELDKNILSSFLSKVFFDCYQQLDDGYSMEQRRTKGFRIREVKDGFFCSVGYPFSVPDAQNPADVAFGLVLRFFKIFEETARLFDFRRKPLCSMAIVFGEVESCFPRAGLLNYEIYGPAIKLVESYEKIRKHFSNQLISSHILVVQDLVYQQLSSQHQSQLAEEQLTLPETLIDEDQQVHNFYYALYDNGFILRDKVSNLRLVSADHSTSRPA